MKKNGFTLVELLAVIVILAVLALIATPVVLSIIDDAKESAMLRSAEMYLSGVENAVMRENMNSGGNFRPNECTITNGNMTCGSTNVEVEVDGEVPSTGSGVFENGKIKEVTLNYQSGTIVKDTNGNLVYQTEDTEKVKTFEDICTYVSGTEKTAGAKYSCEVKEGTSYNFYVLTTPKEGDTTINLIMDRNICEDGTLATAENTCLVKWITDEKYFEDVGGIVPDELKIEGTFCGDTGNCALTKKGPITAMTYLNNATSTWENIDNLDLVYDDEGGNYTDFILNGKARLPYKSEVSEYDRTNKTNEYLYDYTKCYHFALPNEIDGIEGYWILSSSSETLARQVNITLGIDANNFPSGSPSVGVRPVITLKI